MFLFSSAFRPPLRPTQLPIKWVLLALNPGVKRSGREADHSPTSSAEINISWSYHSTLHMSALHGGQLSKKRDFMAVG